MHCCEQNNASNSDTQQSLQNLTCPLKVMWHEKKWSYLCCIMPKVAKGSTVCVPVAGVITNKCHQCKWAFI